MKKEYVLIRINRLLKIVVVTLCLLLLFSVEQVSGSMFLYLKKGNDGGRERVMTLLGVFPLYQFTYETKEMLTGEKSNMLNIIRGEQIALMQKEQMIMAQSMPQSMPQSVFNTVPVNEDYIEDVMKENELYNENEVYRESEADDENEILLPVSGNNVSAVGDNIICAKTKQVEYDLRQFSDFNTFLKEFYAVDSSTGVTQSKLNIEELASMRLQVNPGSDVPQILIYHTHSQEGFADSVPGDMSTTVVGAGEKLAKLLTEYGYNVMHHTGQYDVKRRDDAYANAAPALEEILQTYPSIEVIIDLHRDEVNEGTKLVTEIDGKPCAKFMFFNGLSYNNTLGEISYLPNPNLKENLAFSFQAQVNANEYYPGITRRIYLRGYRYNMQYRGKSMLVELGAQTNTVEEAMNAVEPLAHVIALTLSGEG